jgi:hypothetical protein
VKTAIPPPLFSAPTVVPSSSAIVSTVLRWQPAGTSSGRSEDQPRLKLEATLEPNRHYIRCRPWRANARAGNPR